MTLSSDRIWAVVLLIAAGTYALRYSFFYLFEHFDDVPAVIQRALRFVAPAVLAALVAPTLLIVDGSIVVVGNHRMLAGLVGAVIAWRTESVIWTMVAGVVALVLVQQFL